MKESGRALYTSVTDEEALEGFRLLSKTEGIIPALESAHAVAKGVEIAREIGKEGLLIINLSGRGDKDIAHVMKYLKG